MLQHFSSIATEVLQTWMSGLCGLDCVTRFFEHIGNIESLQDRCFVVYTSELGVGMFTFTEVLCQNNL